MLPEVRMARIVEAIGRYRTGKVTCLEAAELLGMSAAFSATAQGRGGDRHCRCGRASGRRATIDEIEWVIEEFRTRYFNFTAEHFH